MHILKTRDGLGRHETREKDDRSEDSIERSRHETRDELRTYEK